MNSKAFGRQLRYLRKMKGWTQEQLLNELRVEGSERLSKSTVSKWEHGENIPVVPVIEDLEYILGVPRGSLLSQAGYPSYDSLTESGQGQIQRVLGKGDPGDEEILELMAQVFDRPAFTTSFFVERPLADFKKAVTDTIEALNTGVRRLRDGAVIRSIPSRHDLKDTAKRHKLGEIEMSLKHLRARLDYYVNKGDVVSRPYGDDHYLSFSSEAIAKELDGLRGQILDDFRKVSPSFKVSVLPPPTGDD